MVIETERPSRSQLNEGILPRPQCGARDLMFAAFRVRATTRLHQGKNGARAALQFGAVPPDPTLNTRERARAHGH